MTSQRPTIVQISAHYPPFLGGTEAVVKHIALELARRLYDSRVITSRIGYTAAFHDESLPGYTVNRLPAFVVAHLPVIPGLFVRLLSMPPGSIFHVHIVQAFIPEIALLAARLKRAKFIGHFHLDVEPSGKFGFLFKAYKKTLFPYTLRSADKIIVFSLDQKNLVMTNYGVKAAKIAIIPNGVEKEFFIAKKRHLPTIPTLLFAGRLSPQKNVKQLLRALEGISEDFKTIIVGDGELKPDLVALAQKLTLKNIQFVGRATGKEMQQRYKQADLFVLPSIKEGMPLVLLEALAGGLPVVATNVLGNKDLVKDGDNGLLVPLHDVEALRQALRRVKDNPSLYEAMSHQAYHSAAKYSWDNVVTSLEEVYHA